MNMSKAEESLKGKDAEKCLDELVALIDSGFGEE